MYSVTGWARNEYDGSVSTELQGLEEDIDKIIQALYNDRYIEIDDIRGEGFLWMRMSGDSESATEGRCTNGRIISGN